ncbi:SMP-30/gluconolactonase/LRE family protein [Nocardia sp. NPDC057353]|uniref:SMP-30/gluconolactonase/LRE family protein n=1 Tax=Nocardia sp. NPDC057353 TaxID=3346104 RepID=UPI003642FD58
MPLRTAVLAALLAAACTAVPAAHAAPSCPQARTEVAVPAGVPVLDWSENLTVDAAGNLWVARVWRQQLQRYDRSGALTATVPVEYPGAPRLGPDGLLYVVFGDAPTAGDRGGVLRLDPTAADPVPELFATGLTMPNGADFGPDGQLYVATATGAVRLRADGALDPGWSVALPSANGIAIAGDTAYLTSNGATLGRVSRAPLADPAAHTVVADLTNGGLPDYVDDLVHYDGALYAATLTGRLVRVDPATGATCAVLGTQPLTALAADPARPETLLASTEGGAILRITPAG